MKRILPLLMTGLLLAGCATSNTIEKRRVERRGAYDALPAEEKAMVDAGQIRTGMSEDAVFIAWGRPAEVLHSEDASGRVTIWLYRGSYFTEERYWRYHEVPGPGGRRHLERYLETNLDPRSYVSSEIIFKDGRVQSWRTLPKPNY